MEKRPFTPQGLQDLINQLYALPDAELQSEATAIGIDFTLWTNNHFTLSSQQVDFLNAIDERFIAAAASNCNPSHYPLTEYQDSNPGIYTAP